METQDGQTRRVSSFQYKQIKLHAIVVHNYSLVIFLFLRDDNQISNKSFYYSSINNIKTF